jgi:hypothetical protein
MSVDGRGAFGNGRTGCTPLGLMDTALASLHWDRYRAWKISEKTYR